MKLFVITYEVNDYDQYGEYFVMAFAKRPALEDLKSLEVDDRTKTHILAGGGRRGIEREWYTLCEVEEGDLSARLNVDS